MLISVDLTPCHEILLNITYRLLFALDHRMLYYNTETYLYHTCLDTIIYNTYCARMY